MNDMKNLPHRSENEKIRKHTERRNTSPVQIFYFVKICKTQYIMIQNYILQIRFYFFFWVNKVQSSSIVYSRHQRMSVESLQKWRNMLEPTGGIFMQVPGRLLWRPLWRRWHTYFHREVQSTTVLYLIKSS